jgi:hypothetical protein
MMRINEIIDNLSSASVNGYQLSKRNGIIFTTWLIYEKESSYYFFDINQKIEFIDRYKYSAKELINEFSNSEFQIELAIN